METISRRHSGEKLTACRADEVDAFLHTLKVEQARFLSAIRHACSLLSREPGHLAQVAATQSRLTQQFFDAQRSIMSRRAEFDAEVALIGRRAEENAAEVVAGARAQADSGGVCTLAAATHADHIGPDVSHRAAHHQVAALGVTVVRTMAEANSLASVIEDALEPAAPDGAMLQGQLASVLDEWWCAENQSGQAVIKLARAREVMRGHVAQIEAAEILEAAHDADESDESLQPLPPHISAIMDNSDSVSLETLLDMLADSLDPPATAFEPPRGLPITHAAAPIEQAEIRIEQLTIERPSTTIELGTRTETSGPWGQILRSRSEQSVGRERPSPMSRTRPSSMAADAFSSSHGPR